MSLSQFPMEGSKKHDVMLDIKSGGIFEETPTPTAVLYKNCEEYGIFEDLKHVNPFDEIFRHAVQEKTGIPTVERIPTHDEESLHTPQVFPQLEVSTTVTTTSSVSLRQQSTTVESIPETQTNIALTDTTLPDSGIKKYRAIAEKPKPIIQLSVNFADTAVGPSKTTGTAIPVQTVKPLILPKVSTKLKPAVAANSATVTVTSPSSASLTPTSQLPIKERLKAILNNNSKSQRVAVTATESPSKYSGNGLRTKAATGKYDEHCMERRRAAATRYRNKMRNEHKELRRRNSELQAENEKLRTRVTQLEQQLMQKPHATAATAAQIQIPPSSIHLIMNIPKLLVPANGPPLLHNPVTYSVEKKQT